MNGEALNRGSVRGARMVQNGKGKPSKTLLFARNFLQHPKMLGSVIPSSSFLVEQALKGVRWETARVIVEYGPGVGTFTTEILNRMRPDALLVVFEMNPEFVQYLQSSVTDPRLRVVQRSAEEVETTLRSLDCTEVDCVISGIPFSTMPETVRDGILRATFSILRPGGLFVVYQFSRKVLPYLERVFGQVQRGFELLNIFPARLFFCMRQPSPAR
jgi:phospholipid N-methyltransferase